MKFATMTDLYEIKAAVLAAKENTPLPVLVSMTFEENGRTFTGCTVESFAITAEGLGVDGVGINCSLGSGGDLSNGAAAVRRNQPVGVHQTKCGPAGPGHRKVQHRPEGIL